MTVALPPVTSDRFTLVARLRVAVQVPAAHARRILEAAAAAAPLDYGDYDQVAFTSTEGVQQFRVLPTARLAATGEAVRVPCVEVSFLIDDDPATVTAVMAALYQVHPYDEPVICLDPVITGRNRPGWNDSNPNKFWNRPAEDWVPVPHRPE